MELRVIGHDIGPALDQQLEFREDPPGTWELIYVPHAPTRRRGPIHDNLDEDTWTPSTINNGTYATTSQFTHAVPQSVLGDVNGNVMEFTGVPFGGLPATPPNYTGWLFAEGGFTNRIEPGQPASERYEMELLAPLNMLDPCSEWTVTIWGRMKYFVGTFDFVPSPTIHPQQRFMVVIGNVSIFLNHEINFHNFSTRPPQWYVNGGALVQFPCGPEMLGYTHISQTTPVDGEKMLGICIAHDPSTKTIRWAIGSDEDGVYRSGDYQDEFGFAGICPNTNIRAEGVGDGTDINHFITFRKIQITGSAVFSPFAVIAAGL